MGVIKAPSETVAELSPAQEAAKIPKDIEEEEYPSYGYVQGEEGTPPFGSTPAGVTPPFGQTPPYATSQTPPYATNQTPPYATNQTPPYATSQTPPFAGQQMQPQQMPVQQGGYQMYPAPLMYSQPYMPQPQMIYQAPMAGGAPPTIVIDTSPRAMQQGGFLDELHEANNGVPVMGRRSQERRHTTPHSRNRGVSPQARQKGGMSFGGEPLNTGQRITVQKMG